MFLGSTADAATFTVTNTSNTGAGSLRNAINSANAAGPGNHVININVTGTINLASPLPQLNNNITINGPGTGTININGNNQHRIFYANSGNIVISRVNLINGRANGGNGGPGAAGGGGGLGAGAALFVGENANVTIDRVTFGTHRADGGNGGAGFFLNGGGGGGGLGGNGGDTGNFFGSNPGGGGGGGYDGNGGDSNTMGGGGGGGGGRTGNGAASGMSGSGNGGAPNGGMAPGGNGGDGGGGAGSQTGNGGNGGPDGGGGGSRDGNGGNGGRNGGGGGSQNGNGGNGGFGGGGGGSRNGMAGMAGFGGGNGASGASNGGNGGSGLGGAVFVKQGGSLTVIDSFLPAGQRVEAGNGGAPGIGGARGEDGTADGRGYYLHANSVLTLAGSGVGTINDQISGTGSIVKVGTGTQFLNAANNYSGPTTINEGSLIVNGSILSNVTVNGGLLGGSGATGSVTLNRGGTISPGTGIGTLTINGTFNTNAGSNYLAEITPGGAADLIRVNGRAVLNGGNVQISPAPGTYQPGSLFRIVTTTGGVEGLFGSLTDPNFPGTRAVLLHTDNEVFLFLRRPGSVGVGNTFNRRSVSFVFDNTQIFGPEASAVLLALETFNDQDRGRVLDQIVGDIYGSMFNAVITRQGQFYSTVATRLRRPYETIGSGTGIARAQMPEEGAPMSTGGTGAFNMWLSPYGLYGDVRSDGNAVPFYYYLSGFAFGADATVGSDLLAGVVGSIEYLGIRGTEAESMTGVNSYQLGAYGRANISSFWVSGIASVGFDEYRVDRSLVIGSLRRRPTSNFSGMTSGGYGEVGASFDTTGINFQPYVGLQYVNVYRNAFRETGAGALSISSDSTTQNSMRGTIGLRSAFEVNTGWLAVAPEFRLAYIREFLDNGFEYFNTLSGLGAATFPIRGVFNRGDILQAGAGYSIQLGSSLSFDAHYDFFLGSRNTAHAARANFMIRW